MWVKPMSEKTSIPFSWLMGAHTVYAEDEEKAVEKVVMNNLPVNAKPPRIISVGGGVYLVCFESDKGVLARVSRLPDTPARMIMRMYAGGQFNKRYAVTFYPLRRGDILWRKC